MTAERERCRLQLHGEPVLVLPGGRRVALEPRAAALLALAAVEPGVTRPRAAAMLWPDSADPRRNLRQQLLRFRRLFERDLLLGQDTLTLAGDLQIESAEQPLLGALTYDDCEDFAAWLEHQRQREQVRRMDALRTRVTEAEAAGDFDAALRAAHELLALDERDEAHHRECMRLHYLAGNAAAGLAAFERLRRMLDTEFGTPPSAASLQLAEALRTAQRGSATERTLTGRRAALPVTLRRPPLMAGRAKELAAVRQSLAEGRVVWLEGEAGLGKSRLIGDWATSVRGAEGLVLAGAGRPGDGGAPYATLARLLGPWLTELDARLGADARAALKHIAPHGETPPRPDTPALRPGALAAAVAEWLGLHAAACVLLDDLHFADEATIELFAGLAAQAGLPTRWLFATRPAEVPAAGRRLRESLIELQRASVVVLAPLNTEDVAAMVDALSIAGLQGDALAEPLQRHTGGNPLFVLETIKQGLHDGSLARGQLPRPSSVAALIEARLARLSEGALALARMAAIAGVDFQIELAESALGVRAVQLASAWQELQDAQILRDEAFAHDLLSDAVLRGMPAVVARRVHAQCAAWLTEHGGEPSRVARHWLAGGKPAEAAHAFEQAARRASMASRAHEEAELLHQAGAAYAQCGQAERGFEALVGRIEALHSAQMDDAAKQEAAALVDLAQTDAQRVRAQRVRIDMLCQAMQYAEALPLGQTTLELARRIGAREEEVRLACPLAGALCDTGRAVEAHALLLPLQDWVDTQGADDLRATYHGYRARALSGIGRLRDAVTSYDIAVSYRERIGRRDYLGTTLFGLGVVLRNLGRPDRVHACTARGLDCMSDDPSDTANRLIARILHARDSLEFNLFADALRMLEDLQPALEANGSVFWRRANEITRATLWLRLGQPARATQELRQDMPDMPPWMTAMRAMLRAELANAADRPAPAQAVDHACSLVQADPSRRPGMQVRAMRFGEPLQILRQADELAPLLRAQERMGVLQALHVHEARAAVAAGQPARAADAARHALALLAEGFAPDAMYLPEVHLAAWHALRAAGAASEAAAALDAGTRWIRTQGLPQVPAPFLHSFLHRNPVNRGLLAGTSR